MKKKYLAFCKTGSLSEKVPKLYKIPKYNDYYITKKGKIWSKIKSRGKGGYLKPSISAYGYLVVRLKNKTGKHILKYIHRLIAEIFIREPLSNEQVNHKNGNKLDNRIKNLEWVSVQKNLKHALDTKLRDPSKYTRGMKMGHTSKYHGVSYRKDRDRWEARVSHNCKTYSLGTKKDEVAAAIAYDEGIIKLGLLEGRSLNFPKRKKKNGIKC